MFLPGIGEWQAQHFLQICIPAAIWTQALGWEQGQAGLPACPAEPKATAWRLHTKCRWLPVECLSLDTSAME
jgi:hypothetical protein